MRIIQGWAEVARVRDEVRATLIAERLAGADIESAVFSQKDRWYVVAVGGLSVVRVMVPAGSYEEAAGFLAEAPRGPRAGE